MKIKKATEILEKLDTYTCQSALNWAKGLTPYEAWKTCHRGDWLMWISHKLKVDEKKLYLCNAKILYQIIHLMKDSRVRNTVWAVYLYGCGKISFEELREERKAIEKVFDGLNVTTVPHAVDPIVYAAYYAIADLNLNRSHLVASYVASTVDRDANIFADAYTARGFSLAKSADICRAVLTEDVKKFF
jgi:hypothetical protein